MSAVIQFLKVIFEPLVFVFAVSNLFYMGLQVKMPELIAALKNKKAIALIFVWSWVLGPALAYLITMVLPLAEPFKITLLLCSLAPAAKYVPLMVEKARGDMGFTGALIPLVNIGTVVFMPLMAPLMVKGLAVSAGDLAKPLFLTVFLSMALGAALRHYAESAATKILPAVKVIAKITVKLVGVFGARDICPGDDRNGGQLCPPLYYNLHGWDGTDTVSIRFRPETESAKRHVAGYALA